MSEPSSAQVAEAPEPRRKRTGLVLGIVGGALALILIIVAAVVVIPGLGGGSRAVVIGDELTTDRSATYDFTEPLLDIPADHAFEFPAGYDLDELAVENADPEDDFGYADTDFAFGVYYDAALTMRAETIVYQDADDGTVRIASTEVGDAATEENQGRVPIKADAVEPGFTSWGLHEEYYLVRRLEPSGEPLAKPIVTRFTVESELEAPDVSFSSPNGDGSLTVSWEPVEGATRYVVVTSYDTGYDRQTRVLGQSSSTEWSSARHTSSYDTDAPFVDFQNDSMRFFDGSSADELAAGYVWEGIGEGFYDIGVIATDGEQFSPYRSYDAVTILGALPYTAAVLSMNEALPFDTFGTFAEVPRRFLFTSVDGSTRATTTYVVASEVEDIGAGAWKVPLRGRGTDLGWNVFVAAEADIAATVAAFNASAEAAAPTAGMPQFEVVVTAEDVPPIDVAPEVDYPVYGSTDFTRYLAAHFIAQTPRIDVSDYLGKPGVPHPYDAAMEAMYQNPYAINVEGVRLNDDILSVSYLNTRAEAQQLQAGIASAVDETLAAVVTDGMGDAQIVAALNDWLVSRAQYDYAAFTTLQADPTGIPDGFENAWNASGVLVDGVGVCASYAYAFAALANAAGVETVVVTGDVYSAGPHAWNKVLVDGAWYAVDVTWNDSPQGNAYLTIPDSGFTDDAARSEDDQWMIDWSIPEYATP